MNSHPIPDAALESDIAILGKKGRGKSYAARGLVERLLDQGRQVVVLDPLSTWWGLKAGPHAYPIPVLGGPHGDLPLDDADGAALGRHLATSDQSAVLDLGAFRKAELVRFATPLLEELYTHNRKPLWLVLEEADVFAPQQPMPDTTRMLGEVDRIARRGRQFGFKLISLTQRPARLNKDVLTQLSTLVALGLTSPQDRDAIKAWVEGAGDRDKAKEVIESLAALAVGEGWVWSPDHEILARVRFPKIKTPDTSATPKAGETRKVAAIRKDVDVAALRAALVSRQTASDDTQRPSSSTQLTQATRPASPAEIAAAEQRGYDRGYESAAKQSAAETRTFLNEMRHRLAHFEERLDSSWFYRDEGCTDGHFPDPKTTAPHVAKRTGKTAKTTENYSKKYSEPMPAAPKPSVASGTLNSAATKMLAVLDTNPPVRRSWRQVATLAGLKARGGHFNAGRKGLVDGGLVATDGTLVAILRPSADAGPEVRDPAALVETWAGSLSGAAPKILRTLFGAGGSLRRADVAARLGMQPRGGHWNAAWKELRDNGLVVLDGDVALLSDLFRLQR